MNNRIAFFDVDGTIYKGSTTHDLINYLHEKSLIPHNFYNEYWEFDKKYRNADINYQQVVEGGMSTVMKSLNRLSTDTIKKALETYFSQKHKIHAYTLPLLQYLKKKDFKIFLVSAGIEPAIQAIVNILGGVDKIYTSTQEIKDNRFISDGIKILHSQEKAEIVKNIINSNKSSLSIGFGDTTGDLAMLEQMNLAFVIQPHQQELIDLAEKNNWNIINDISTAKIIIQSIEKNLY